MGNISYNELLSRRASGIRYSGIRKYFDIAAGMKNVISLSVGEPDFKTPWQARKQAILALEKGKTAYTSNAGTDELRKEIGIYMKRTVGADYDPKDQIIVTVGGSEAIDLAVRTLVNPGDKVLIPEPCFVCYSPITALAGGIPVPIVTKSADRFKLTPKALKDAITSDVKALVLPYPNNPTGAVMRKSELEEIAAVLRGTNIIVISDEIYSELTYGGQEHVSIASLPDMEERTVIINGFSKSFAMTGWRLGWAAGPEPIISQMLKIHQYAIMCAPTISQTAALAALRECSEEINYMTGEYDMRRKLCVKGFTDMGLDCFTPEGAFYVFPSIAKTGLSSQDFCMRLLKEKQIAVVPGDAFGESGEGFVRVSYAYSMKHLSTAMKRIEEFLTEL
jgi:aminotransferase